MFFSPLVLVSIHIDRFRNCLNLLDRRDPLQESRHSQPIHCQFNRTVIYPNDLAESGDNYLVLAQIEYFPRKTILRRNLRGRRFLSVNIYPKGPKRFPIRLC